MKKKNEKAKKKKEKIKKKKKRNTSIVKEIVDERFIFKCGDVYALTGLFNKLFVENLTPLNKDYLPLSPEQFLSKVIN